MEELKYLTSVKQIIQDQIEELEEQIENTESDIFISQKDIHGETSHAISGSLYGAESFEQLVELSQFATELNDNISKHENQTKELEKLKKQALSPYFARIDFIFPDEKESSPIYIGRHSLMEDIEILIHDWRSPIAGLFYRYGSGKASYEAPVGTITGEISGKRQYEIRDGKLEYFFDTDVEIVDEYLRQMLSKNASGQMKNIVETIQREQDVAIRDDRNKVLVVQGVAGSGKTSVAMHRIAYLMYKGLTDRLASNEVIIISPNNVFEQYVSGVLPELGEENVRSYILEELFEKIIGKPRMQSRYGLMEQLVAGEGYWVPVLKRSLEFKCSRDFVKIMNNFSVRAGSFKELRSAYRELFNDRPKLDRLAEKAGVDLPEDIDDIVQFTCENLSSSKLFFDDASVLSYLYLTKIGKDIFSEVKQVVIDEAQDYYYIHYQIFKLLFPKAKYTILGDIRQTVAKAEDMSMYDQILQVLNKEPHALITLEKSYRCTKEIMEFSAKILDAEIDSLGRSGTAPVVKQLDKNNRFDILVEDTRDMLKKGYGSVGIICKSEKECKKLYKNIKDKIEVGLFEDSAGDDISGVFILPVYLAKGLEFDVSLVWDVNESTYYAENDKSLLFIACTRAMHELNLYYTEDISPLIYTGSCPT